MKQLHLGTERMKEDKDTEETDKQKKLKLDKVEWVQSEKSSKNFGLDNYSHRLLYK